MNVFLWSLAGLLAAIFLAAGGLKLSLTKSKLVASPNMGWAEDFPPTILKTIGALEVLGAVGLILPAAFEIGTVLVPIAATCLALLMVGAAATHAKRDETAGVAVNLVLLVMAIVLAWGRFGSHAFS